MLGVDLGLQPFDIGQLAFDLQCIDDLPTNGKGHEDANHADHHADKGIERYVRQRHRTAPPQYGQDHDTDKRKER